MVIIMTYCSSMVKNPAAHVGRRKFDLCVRKIPWRKKWQPTPLYFARRIPGTEETWQATVQGFRKSET